MTIGIRSDSLGTYGAIQVNSVDRLTISETGELSLLTPGSRITGDFSNATIANRVMFQTNVIDGITRISAIPGGSAPNCGLDLYSSIDPNNASVAQIVMNGVETRIQSNKTGSGSYLPMTLWTGGYERMRITDAGNVGIGTSPSAKLHVLGTATHLYFGYNDTGASYLDGGTFAFRDFGANEKFVVNTAGDTYHRHAAGGLGYGAGAGGSVTQATSKGTSVIIHKPCGRIITHNAALAAAAGVSFTVNNNLVSANDTVVITLQSGNTDIYTLRVVTINNGNFVIRITNNSGASASDSIIFNYALIKGAIT